MTPAESLGYSIQELYGEVNIGRIDLDTNCMRPNSVNQITNSKAAVPGKKLQDQHNTSRIWNTVLEAHRWYRIILIETSCPIQGLLPLIQYRKKHC